MVFEAVEESRSSASVSSGASASTKTRICWRVRLDARGVETLTAYNEVQG